MSVVERLAQVPDLQVRAHEPLRDYTSFRIGGPADVLALPHTVAALQQAIAAARELCQPLTIIGSGTNLLVRDGGVRGIVLRLAENLAAVSAEGTAVHAQAGARMAAVARAAAEASLTGLEFAAGIPGTLGGAILMNAGAYEGEMAQVVEWAEVVEADGRLTRLRREELGFSYRHSALMEGFHVVVGARMALQVGDRQAIRAHTAELLRRRESKQPLELPSAGSVFKRPPGHFASQLIDQAGCKGMQVGQAQVSPKHAGFIVNLGGARAVDVEELVRRVQQAVADQFGVHLEPEIRIIGEAAPSP